MIGVVGGVGPYAGLDLARKICDQTLATTDQDHLPLVVVSIPRGIEDRTRYLLGQTDTNPGHALADIVFDLERARATVVGIPCNTAHAPPIFDAILDRLDRVRSTVKVVHMLNEVLAHLRTRHPRVGTVGVLSTTGTQRSGIYTDLLASSGIAALAPPDDVQEALVHPAIYDPDYGIKAQASPVSERARRDLLAAADGLIERGAEAIVLGCTELPLALPEPAIGDVPLVDPTLVLARALIREEAPHKLRPL